MAIWEAAVPSSSGGSGLTNEERRSVTHGDFWIPEDEREKYKRALGALNRAGIPFVVSGAYAIYEHTGIYRETKDLDLFLTPDKMIEAAAALRDEGFRMRLEQPHWLAKATLGEHFVDLIFGMGNGLALIDDDWYRYSKPAILAASPVRVSPVEELIWHRLFISERHRHDMADILHLILCQGSHIDWHRLLEKTGEHWPLLLSQLQMFSYVYPEARSHVPPAVIDTLLERSREDLGRERGGDPATRGPMISRFSFAIDVNEWGMLDLREQSIRIMEQLPVVRRIAAADIWEDHSDMTRDYLRRYHA
jgi:hypothetical protein